MFVGLAKRVDVEGFMGPGELGCAAKIEDGFAALLGRGDPRLGVPGADKGLVRQPHIQSVVHADKDYHDLLDTDRLLEVEVGVFRKDPGSTRDICQSRVKEYFAYSCLWIAENVPVLSCRRDFWHFFKPSRRIFTSC